MQLDFGAVLGMGFPGTSMNILEHLVNGTLTEKTVVLYWFLLKILGLGMYAHGKLSKWVHHRSTCPVHSIEH